LTTPNFIAELQRAVILCLNACSTIWCGASKFRTRSDEWKRKCTYGCVCVCMSDVM